MVDVPKRSVPKEHARTVSRNYRLIEKILHRGFLSATVDIVGTPLSFRSLNGRELESLGFRTKGLPVFDRDCEILATAVYAMDGYLLHDKWGMPLRQFFADTFTKGQISALVDGVLHLRNVYADSLAYVEGFSYTHKSHNIWSYMRGRDLMSPSTTGYPFTGDMGFCDHHAMWTILMSSLDNEHRSDREASMALLTGSMSNHKAAKEIRDKRTSARSGLEDEREQIVKFGSRVFLEKEFKDTRDTGWATFPSTRESMVEEIRRIAAGEKDKHDLFIEGYLKRKQEEARDAYYEGIRLREEEIARNQKLGSISYGSSVVTPEELARYRESNPGEIMFVGKSIIGGKK